MSTRRKAETKPMRVKAMLAVSALGALGVLGTLYVRHLEADKGDPQAGSPAPSVEPRPRPVARASHPEHPAPRIAKPSQAPSKSASPRRSTPERERVENWILKTRDYHEDDRASVLDAALEALLKNAAENVLEIEQQLAELSVYDQKERAAAFHALGKLGKELAGSKDPKAKEAIAAIHRMTKAELELPSMVEPAPEVDVETLTEHQRHELLHEGILVEEKGELWHPTTLNKLPVIRTLVTIGGDESLAQLKKLSEVKDNSVGVRFAVEQAIEVASR